MIGHFAAQRRQSLLARAAVGLLSVVLASSSLPVFPALVRAVGGDPIRYTYDPSGRLSAVIDPTAGSAAYAYDAAGNITKQAYLKRARSLLNSIPGGDILAHTRRNGDILRYNRRTNEFAVAAADGTIRTLFRPKEGMAYWLSLLGP